VGFLHLSPAPKYRFQVVVPQAEKQALPESVVQPAQAQESAGKQELPQADLQLAEQADLPLAADFAD
jgi:hypothetical protein